MTPVRVLRGRTLRTRLTALLVAVLLAATAVAGAATALSLRTFLLGRLDAQLSAAENRFADEDGDGDADDVAPGQAVGTLGVRLDDGRVAMSALVASGGRTRPADLSPADVRALDALPVGGEARTVDLEVLHDYRLQAVAADGDVQVTGLPEAEVDATMRRLIAVESVLFVVVIVAAAAVVTVVVRRTLRPLQALADTARDVTRLPLSAAATPLPTPPRAVDATSEVGQVGTAFAQMLEHIRSALAERDATEERLRRFVADASHEFRTPLATVRAHSELVQHAPVPLPADAAHSLRRIDAAADRMSAMVEDLLLLARLDDDDAADVASARADLSRVVVEAVVEARTLAPDHHWVLRLPDAPVAAAAPADRLERVVVNLLTNARVHTPPGTEVVVAVDPAGDDGRVTLTVTDDGPGVAPTVLPRVFDRFTRGDVARTSSTGGTGLGLSLVRAVVRAHGGDVGVTSRPGRTVFAVRLPAVRDTSAVPTAPAGQPLEAL